MGLFEDQIRKGLRDDPAFRAGWEEGQIEIALARITNLTTTVRILDSSSNVAVGELESAGLTIAPADSDLIFARSA